MSNIIRAGESRRVPCVVKESYTKAKGFTLIEEYKGTKAEILGLFLAAANSGVAAANYVEHKGAYATLTIEIANSQKGEKDEGDADTVTLWELSWNEITTNIKAHNSIKPSTDAQRNNLAAVDDYFDNSENYKNLGYANISAAVAALSDSRATKYFQHLMNGTTDFIIAQPVLTQTVTFGDLVSADASLADIMKRVSAPTLTPAPPFAVPTQTMSGTTGAYEWLKKGPRVTQQSDGKYTIVTEYYGYEKLSSDLYGGTDTP